MSGDIIHLMETPELQLEFLLIIHYSWVDSISFCGRLECQATDPGNYIFYKKIQFSTHT